MMPTDHSISVADAAFHTVHDYPGGAAALGLRLGKRSLSDEVNPNCGHAKFGLVDATKAQLLARDYRILYAMALELGHYPPVPMPSATSDAELPSIQLVSELAREFGELMGSVTGSLGDGRISDNELRQVTQAWGELVAAGQNMLAQFTALNEAAKLQAGKA